MWSRGRASGDTSLIKPHAVLQERQKVTTDKAQSCSCASVCVCVCVCVLYVCFRKDIVIRSLEWREGVSGVPNRHTSRKKHRQKLTHYTHTLSLAHTHTPVRSQVWGMVRDVSAVPPSSSIMTGEWWEGPCEEVVQKNMLGWTNQGTPAEPKLFTHTHTHTNMVQYVPPHSRATNCIRSVAVNNAWKCLRCWWRTSVSDGRP